MNHQSLGPLVQALSPAALEQVQEETFIERYEFHEQLASTNDQALKRAGNQADCLPLLVVTNHQTGGRGRGTNSWWASSGSLAFSLLLDTEQHQLPPSRWPQVSLTAGLAVCEAIEDVMGEDLLGNGAARLKWPNDVYLNGRKVSGVLVEAPASAPQMLVLGVGVNVNNTLEGAPPELAGTAIALCELVGQQLSLSTVLTQVLVRIGERLSWVGSRDDELYRRWRARCMLTSRSVRLDVGSRCIEGVCQGIDEEGALIVHTEDGVDRCFGGVVTHF